MQYFRNFNDKLATLKGKQVSFNFKNYGGTYVAKLIHIDIAEDYMIVQGRWSDEEYFRLSNIVGFYPTDENVT